MRSKARDALPLSVRRMLRKFGQDIATARRKRALTMRMMADRTGVALSTYQRIEKGDPSVALGLYAMVLFSLGVGERLGNLLDIGSDDIGLLLDQERLPKRVRPRQQTDAL